MCISGKSYLILFLGVLVCVGSGRRVSSQTSADRYVESLSAEDVIAGFTANLNRIRTYKAAFVVSDPNGKDVWEHEVGWERVPGSSVGLADDKRFHIISGPPSADRSRVVHFAYNGVKAFRHELHHKGVLQASFGEILPAMDEQMTGIGLTIASISTHYNDGLPFDRIVANGTFVKEGIETVNGRKCVAIYGKLGWAKPGPAQVTHDTGVYVRLLIDPLSGFMPVQQKYYWVENVDGKLVREDRAATYTAQFKEFQDGTWFPVAGSYSDPDGVVKRVLTVKECVLNIDIPEDEFAIKWPPGTIVDDRVANISFTVPRALPDDLSAILAAEEPEERTRQAETVEEALATEAAKPMQEAGEDANSVPEGRPSKRPSGLFVGTSLYATIGGICLVLGGAFFGLGRWISSRRSEK